MDVFINFGSLGGHPIFTFFFNQFFRVVFYFYFLFLF